MQPGLRAGATQVRFVHRNAWRAMFDKRMHVCMLCQQQCPGWCKDSTVCHTLQLAAVVAALSWRHVYPCSLCWPQPALLQPYGSQVPTAGQHCQLCIPGACCHVSAASWMQQVPPHCDYGDSGVTRCVSIVSCCVLQWCCGT